MKIELTGRQIKVTRNETDRPHVPEPIPRPANFTRKDYNSWRKDYYLRFDSEPLAKAAFEHLETLADFDTAAAWLDKQ